METLMADVNWLAVCVGAAAAFLVGWFWYSDNLFGKKWREGIGVSETDNSPMMPAMVTQVVATFLLAWVIGLTETMQDLSLAILIALTIASIIKANGLFSQKSRYAIMVEAGFVLVMVVVMIATHAVL